MATSLHPAVAFGVSGIAFNSGNMIGYLARAIRRRPVGRASGTKRSPRSAAGGLAMKWLYFFRQAIMTKRPMAYRGA